jgi:hypothetical protein
VLWFDGGASLSRGEVRCGAVKVGVVQTCLLRCKGWSCVESERGGFSWVRERRRVSSWFPLCTTLVDEAAVGDVCFGNCGSDYARPAFARMDAPELFDSRSMFWHLNI